MGIQVDRYLDLNTAQKPHVKQAITRWLDWHRRAQLICYAELIDEFKNRAHSSLNHLDLSWLESQLSAYYETLMINAIEPGAIILSNLDTSQINHLEKRLAKDHQKLARQLKRNKNQRQRKKTKETLTGMKRWFGKLSPTQITWVSTRSKALPDADAPWLEYRIHREQSLIELLRAKPNPKVVSGFIDSMWINAETSMTLETQMLMTEIRTQSRAMAVAFYAMATSRQKTHFWGQLQSYRNDFIQLANDSSGASCELPIITAPRQAVEG
ncbi:MAG: hypothetical protein KUG71_14160 [Porticoccaceae bacterium]|nr:hypothetical protein [Porticoccaceae bacterium]